MADLFNGDIVIAVDFDGTITTEPEYTKKMELQPYCKEALRNLYSKGVRFVLWTCREGKSLEEAIHFLKQNNMFRLFETVNRDVDDVLQFYNGVRGRKVCATYYIDDRNLLGHDIDWEHIERKMNAILSIKELL